jgi:hypothetical protein
MNGLPFKTASEKLLVVLNIIQLVIIIVLCVSLFGFMQNGAASNTSNPGNTNTGNNQQTPTATPTAVITSTPSISPTTTQNAASTKKVSFVAGAKTLARPSGKNTEFTFTIPQSATLTRISQTPSEAENVEIGHTIKGSDFEMTVGMYYETFPFALKNVTEIDDKAEFGKVLRHKYATGERYGYVNSITTTGTCTNVDGAKIASPCGTPTLTYQDGDLKSYLTIVCTGTNINACDDIVKSLVINPAL